MRTVGWVTLWALCACRHDFETTLRDGDEAAVDLVDSLDAVEATDDDGCTFLVVAARSGDAVVAERLLQRGASTGARDSWGFTPLQLSARVNALATARALLVAGAEVDLGGGESDGTALDEAVIQGNRAMVDLLLEARADVNARDRWGETALHYLARDERHAAALLPALLDRADLNARDVRGWSPLHIAAENDNAAFIRTYTPQRDLDGMTAGGETALDIAVRRHADNAATTLIRLGAHRRADAMTPLDEAAARDQPERVERLLAHAGVSVPEIQEALALARDRDSRDAEWVLSGALNNRR